MKLDLKLWEATAIEFSLTERMASIKCSPDFEGVYRTLETLRDKITLAINIECLEPSSKDPVDA